MVVAAADAGSGIACATDEAPPLLVEPGHLMAIAFYGSCTVLVLMFIHYIQPVAKAATRAFEVESSSERPDTLQSVVLGRAVKVATDHSLWMRHVDWPWLEAKFEGDAFDNFVITLILESILNATNTANTHLEGDLTFSNDPSNNVIIVSWLLCAMEVISILILISEKRRSSGKACWCLKPHALNDPGAGFEKHEHKRIVVQLITWFSLVHDAFQITIASVATASQVASAGAPRSAMLINSIEVSALVFVKCYNLYSWADKWREQNGKAKLVRAKKQLAGFMGAVRMRVVAVSAMMGIKQISRDSSHSNAPPADGAFEAADTL